MSVSDGRPDSSRPRGGRAIGARDHYSGGPGALRRPRRRGPRAVAVTELIWIIGNLRLHAMVCPDPHRRGDAGSPPNLAALPAAPRRRRSFPLPWRNAAAWPGTGPLAAVRKPLAAEGATVRADAAPESRAITPHWLVYGNFTAGNHAVTRCLPNRSPHAEMVRCFLPKPDWAARLPPTRRLLFPSVPGTGCVRPSITTGAGQHRLRRNQRVNPKILLDATSPGFTQPRNAPAAHRRGCPPQCQRGRRRQDPLSQLVPRHHTA